jgi:hypothetical protein
MLPSALLTLALAAPPETNWKTHYAERQALARQVVSELAARDYAAVAGRLAVQEGGASREATMRALEVAMSELGAPSERSNDGWGEGRTFSISRLADRDHPPGDWQGVSTLPETVWVNFENAGPGFVFVRLPLDPVGEGFPIIDIGVSVATDNPRVGVLESLVPRINDILAPPE